MAQLKQPIEVITSETLLSDIELQIQSEREKQFLEFGIDNNLALKYRLQTHKKILYVPIVEEAEK